MKNKKFSKKIAIRAIVFIFISFLFGMTVWGGIRPLTVISGSMEPTIKTGSICFIEKNWTEFEDVKEGDIITFEIGNSLVTHRIVEITEDGIITKGDANDSKDVWIVKSDMYYGKELFSVPYIGYISGFIRQHIAETIICIIAITAVMIFFKRGGKDA